MKVALSLSGMPRFINNSLESQLISLGLTLNNNDSIDIHSCLWGNSNEIREAKEDIYKATESAKEYLKCKIQIATINAAKYEQASSDNLFEECDSSSIYSMYYCLLEAACALNTYTTKRGFEYDLIIRSRSDSAFGYCIDLKTLAAEKQSNSVILQEIPEHISKAMGGKNYVNDQVYFADPRLSKLLSSAYFHLERGSDEYSGCYNSETFLYRYIEIQGIRKEFIPPLTCVQRKGKMNENKKLLNAYIKLRDKKKLLVYKNKKMYRLAN